MSKIKILTFSFLSILFLAFSQESATCQTIKIKVEINYGKNNEIQEFNVIGINNITALEALQKVTVVETHPVKENVFVTSINSTKAERGKTAWYYKVNGTPAETLAINKELKNGDVVSWRFTEDVCSKTIENP